MISESNQELITTLPRKMNSHRSDLIWMQVCFFFSFSFSSRREETIITAIKKIDLSPLFNWNTKQLFVYVMATYPSSDNTNNGKPISQSVIWDTIIPAPESPYTYEALRESVFRLLGRSSGPTYSPSGRRITTKQTRAATPSSKNKKKGKNNSSRKPGMLRLKNQRQKYQITDITGHLAEKKNVTLSVGWNVQPWIGALLWAPESGIVPSTEGLAAESEKFDFPPLKDKAGASGSNTQSTV